MEKLKIFSQSKYFVISESKNKIRTLTLDTFIIYVPNKFNISRRNELIMTITIHLKSRKSHEEIRYIIMDF
jgi:hypothetical protein